MQACAVQQSGITEVLPSSGEAFQKGLKASTDSLGDLWWEFLRLERDISQGHVLIGYRAMASKCKTVGLELIGRNSSGQ